MINQDRIIAEIQKAFTENLNLVKKLPVITPAIAEAVQILIAVYQQGGKMILLGNGGSAADAQHLAAEMLCRFLRDRRPLPAIALNTNNSALTAIANDYDFRDVFSRQLSALATSRDAVIAISTSGRSENVLRAARLKGDIGFRLIALTGEDESELTTLADVTIAIPDSSTPRIQEGHILVGHILCACVERELFSCNDA